MEVKSFSEIVPEKKSFDVDERIAFSELVGKEFIVKNYELFPQMYEIRLTNISHSQYDQYGV